ncbi:MAG: pyridoxal 5'-phosphate synthase glutaminase subunit PdxT [Thermoplasmata archaeon]
MKIGVLAVQGAVSEHFRALEKAFDDLDILDGSIHEVRDSSALVDVSGLIIPGGESSTISRLLDLFEIRDTLIKKHEKGMPIMGTCAGTVLLASHGDRAVERSDTKLLSFMDMSIERNAFGRQKRSFEAVLDIEGVADDFHSVFIRAPAITDCGDECRVLSVFHGTIVAAEQDNCLALVFHPELTRDTRVHQYFIKKIL